MDSLTSALATFTRLLPHSVTDQASKMFVKRLLKAFFDRVEDIVARILWVALSGLFQAFWLLVFQRVVRRATTPATSRAPSVASSSSASVTASRSWSPAREGMEERPVFVLSPADAAVLGGAGEGPRVEGRVAERIEGRRGGFEGASTMTGAGESSGRAEHIGEKLMQARVLAEERMEAWLAANRDSRKVVEESPVMGGTRQGDGAVKGEKVNLVISGKQSIDNIAR